MIVEREPSVEELDGVVNYGADYDPDTGDVTGYFLRIDYRDGSHVLSYTATGWRETGGRETGGRETGGRVELVEPG